MIFIPRDDATRHSRLLPPGPAPRPAPALVPRRPELGGLLRGEAHGLRLDPEELLPAWRLLGRDGGWRLSLGRGRGCLLAPGLSGRGGLLSGDEGRIRAGPETICLDSETDHD